MSYLLDSTNRVQLFSFCVIGGFHLVINIAVMGLHLIYPISCAIESCFVVIIALFDSHDYGNQEIHRVMVLSNTVAYSWRNLMLMWLGYD